VKGKSKKAKMPLTFAFYLFTFYFLLCFDNKECPVVVEEFSFREVCHALSNVIDQLLCRKLDL
jgi:hypothetical protein